MIGFAGKVWEYVEFRAGCIRHRGLKQFVSWGIPHWFTWRRRMGGLL